MSIQQQGKLLFLLCRPNLTQAAGFDRQTHCTLNLKMKMMHIKIYMDEMKKPQKKMNIKKLNKNTQVLNNVKHMHHAASSKKIQANEDEHNNAE